MIKAAFFDIDGTLLSFKTHQMPASTVEVLRRLRERGVKTVISSGRPAYQLTPSLRTGFDAYITLSGQLCFDDEGVYRSTPIDPADVRAVVGRAQEGLFDLLVMQRDRAFVSAHGERVIETERTAALSYEEDDLARAFDGPVYQFCAFIDPADDHLVLDVTSSVATTRWTTLFCDVVPREGGKAFGVAATLERMGLTPDEAIAFGDGENDLSMFEAVGTSVAMGNAWDEVKERASYVTTDVDHDGIWHACEHFGLL